MKKVWIGASLLLAVVTAREGLAAEVTLYTGIQQPGGLSVNNLPIDTKLGGVFGARFAAGRTLGFEQTFGLSLKFLESEQRAFNTQSNLVLTVPTGRVAPYATVGAGLITTFGTSLFSLSDFGTKFTVNYGGGVKLRKLAGPMGLRFDVRGYSVPAVFDQTLTFVEGSVGLMFSW